MYYNLIILLFRIENGDIIIDIDIIMEIMMEIIITIDIMIKNSINSILIFCGKLKWMMKWILLQFKTISFLKLSFNIQKKKKKKNYYL